MISSQTEKLKGGYRWYLVVAHAGRERLARYHLERQGYDVYLPMRAPLIANRRAEPRPMFPRYLFVSVDLAKPGWRAIYSTIGVQSIMTSGVGEEARPRPVPNALIEALQVREVDGLITLPPKATEAECKHKAGDRVHIPVGRQFGGVEGVFEERVDAKRVALLISLLGRDSRVVVPLSSVKRGQVR